MVDGSCSVMLGTLVMVCGVMAVATAVQTEPMCLSRYDYDYKVLSQLVRLEQEQKQLKQTIEQHEGTIRLQEDALKKQRESLEEHFRTLQDRLDGFDDRVTVPGSTYIRWGRATCPGNGTETVYSGYAGGSFFQHTGAAVNTLCLPSEPLWGEFDDNLNDVAPVYPVEYEIFGSFSQKLFKQVLGNHDATCAVCRSVRASSVMIPARNACYPGWTLEYTGYLVAGHISHTAATEFICLDGDPDPRTGGEADTNGKLLYVAEARCAGLKCPPYVNGRELTCVVCTK